MNKAIVVLHNFSKKDKENYSDIIETAYVGNNSKMINLASNNYRKNTKRIREITKSVSALDLEQHPGKTT